MIMITGTTPAPASWPYVLAVVALLVCLLLLAGRAVR